LVNSNDRNPPTSLSLSVTFQVASANTAFSSIRVQRGIQHDIIGQEAVIHRLESDLAKSEIRAPFTGFIVTLHTEIGQWLDRGGDVVEMVDLSSVLVRVNVPESALPFVHVGQRVPVLVEALGQTFEGTVRHVILQADPTAHTFPVEVEIPNPECETWANGPVPPDPTNDPTTADRPAVSEPAPGSADPSASRSSAGSGLLAAGMFARATVISGPPGEVPAVPKDAIVMRDGVQYATMIQPGKEPESLMGIPVPVTTGVDIGDWIAVTSGNLQPGMRVVTRGNEGILFPSPVAIVEYAEGSAQRPAEAGAASPNSGSPSSGTEATRPAADSGEARPGAAAESSRPRAGS